MTETDTDTDTIARYLLGQLAEADADRLEARLLAEPELFETAEATEDEVIDRYARGEMGSEERAQFEQHLLGTQRIRERLAFARALAGRTGARADDPRPAAQVLPHRGRFGWGSASRFAWAAALILAIVSGWTATGLLHLRSDLGRTRSELAAARSATERAQSRADDLEHAAARVTAREADLREELEAERARARERIAEIETKGLTETGLRVRRPIDKGKKLAGTLPTASLVLALATRGSATPKTLHLGDLGDARQVELDLDLEGARPHGTVRALVGRDGEPVWSQDGLGVESVAGETVVRLTLPRERLEAGRYRIELYPVGAVGAEGEDGAPLGFYELRVGP